MTTLETLTTNLQACSIKFKRFEKLLDLKKNSEWVESVNNSILEAKEMENFLNFYNKNEIIQFFSTQEMIFTTYLEMFFYDGWMEGYENNFEILRLSVLKSNLQAYCLFEFNRFNFINDIFKVIKSIIYIYTEILSIIEN